MKRAANQVKDQVTPPRYWVVIPAAGTGSRMLTDVPKQYLMLGDYPLIEHTLMRLAQHPDISGIVVAIAADDRRWNEAYRSALAARLGVGIATVIGGEQRHISVLNVLNALLFEQLSGLADRAAAQDWVLVHDAARPCVTLADLKLLLATIANDPVGGLLGIPVADTMKRVDDQGLVEQTVCRDGLWRALTPQMFRLGPLQQALRDAAARGQHVTDDASAMELAGYRPRMVAGNEQNIKVTRPEDLELARLYLRQQEAQQ
jgi:2-C-methyl-D-erythritol 4-phosphate cytidylyltransferase